MDIAIYSLIIISSIGLLYTILHLVVGYTMFRKVYAATYHDFWRHVNHLDFWKPYLPTINKVQKKLHQVVVNPETKKEITVFELFTPEVKNSNKAVLFIHGANWDHNLGYKHIWHYAKKGYKLYCFNLPGFGKTVKSRLEQHTFGWIEARYIDEITKFIKTQNIKQLGIHGESLGGFYTLTYACNYDTNNNVDWFVTESAPIRIINGFDIKLNQVLPSGFKWLKKWLILTFNTFFKHNFKMSIKDLDLTAELNSIKKPIYLMHTMDDKVTNFYDRYTMFEQEYFATAKNWKFWFPENGNHVVLLVENTTNYLKNLEDFINALPK